MGDDPAPTLLDLPPCVVLSIAESLVSDHPLRVGALCVAHPLLNAALSSPDAQPIWAMLCRRHGARASSTSERPKESFGRHAATLCKDCHKHTRYQFALLKHRLCESCERASPHKYALVTLEQLLHEPNSLVADLSSSQRRRLFGSTSEALPSLELGSHRWFLRPMAMHAARRALQGDRGAAPGAEAFDVSDADPEPVPALATGAVTVGQAGSTGLETDDEADEAEEADEGSDDGAAAAAAAAASSAGAVAAAWDAAAAEHTAHRRPGQAQRAAQRDERKAHKRRVKAEQRERRAAATTAALPASMSGTAGRAVPGSRHKPKRCSAREHREARATSGWEATLERLEAEFGEDLCGLSGLVLG